MQNTPRLITWDTDAPNVHPDNYDGVVNCIRKISNPYTGNKKKLLSFIGNVISKHNLNFNSCFDAFSGSSVVSLFMKGIGKNVLSNDILSSCYLQSVALVENDGVKLNDDHIDYLLKNDNKNKSTFVQDRWMVREGGNSLSQRFSTAEAKQLDNIRANLKDLAGCISQSIGMAASNLLCMRLPFGFIDKSIDIYSHRKKQIEKYGKNSENHDRRIGIYYDQEMNLNFSEWFPKYVKMIQNVEMRRSVDAKISHAIWWHGLQNFIYRKCYKKGQYNSGQVLAHCKKRVDEDGEFVVNKRELKHLTFTEIGKKFTQKCISTNCDVIDLLASGFVDVDCAYFDPPYGGSSSDYGYLYQFFEEYIYEDKVENLEHYRDGHMDRFSGKGDYETNFTKMLELSGDIPIWLFSFNDSSWNGLDHILNIIRQFRDNTIVESRPHYRYNYRKDKKNKLENEHIIVARK